jgi:hypothetical protein
MYSHFRPFGQARISAHPLTGYHAAGWACGAGRFAAWGQSLPGSSRSSRKKDHFTFYILHSAFSLELALQGQGFGGEGVGGLDSAGVFVPQPVDTGGGQGQFLVTGALHLADPGVGIESGQDEKLVAGLFDPVFHPQPVEQRALGPLLAGGEFN